MSDIKTVFSFLKGAVSELHIGAFGSHFWMALFEGRKKWTFFDPRITNRLRPRYLDSFDPVFDIDLTEAITEEATTIKMLRPYSLVLEPGQVLFVPAGSPHRVENLENSVAVSGNFVNDSNADEAAQHLIRNALLDHRAGDLLREWLHRGLIK